MDLATHAAEMLAYATANPLDPRIVETDISAARRAGDLYSRIVEVDGERVKVMLTRLQLEGREVALKELKKQGRYAYILSVARPEGGRLDNEGLVAIVREAFLPGAAESPSTLGTCRQFLKFGGE